jgi:hypothetical protein
MKIALLVVTLVFSAHGFAKELPVPVVIGERGAGTVDACPSTGGVAGLKSKKTSFLAVRSGPGIRYAMLDKLYEEQNFSMCSISKDGQWHGIVYSDDSSIDCSVSAAVDKPRTYTGKCKSGWVHHKWLKVIAG